MPKILSDVLTYGMQLFQLCPRTRTDASRVHTDNLARTEVKEGQRRLKQVYRASYNCMAHMFDYTYQKPFATSLFNLRLPTQKKYRNIHFNRSLILGCHVLIEFANRLGRDMSLNPTDLSIYLST